MKPNLFSDITIMTQQQAIFFGLTLHVIVIILMVLTMIYIGSTYIHVLSKF